MKRLLIVLFILGITYMLTADGTPAEGSRTETDPYLIATLDNLLWLSTTESVWVTDIYFLQTADIDASATQNWNYGQGFSSIGNSEYKFQGIYNGDEHIIDGLYIGKPGID
ncbi:MAG: hypothetical protein K9N06_07025 [Candidatus Cloacimonetes bacterium]|nr:hypothetical protein [Candidatus Cloacimonadota bacterium]